jgi:hypothetical protein
MALIQWKEGTASSEGRCLKYRAFRFRPFPALFEVSLDNGMTSARGTFPKVESMLMDKGAPQGLFNAFILLGMSMDERMPWEGLGSEREKCLGAISIFPQDMRNAAISTGLGMDETRGAIIRLCRERYLEMELKGSLRYRLTQKGAIADRILSAKLIRLGQDGSCLPSEVLGYIGMKSETLCRITDFYRARMEYGMLAREERPGSA